MAHLNAHDMIEERLWFERRLEEVRGHLRKARRELLADPVEPLDQIELLENAGQRKSYTGFIVLPSFV